MPSYSRVIYFGDGSSDIETYKRSGWVYSLLSNVEKSASAVVNSSSGSINIATWCTDITGLTTWDAGNWDFNLYCDVDDTSGSSEIIAECYRRTSGSEFLIASGSSYIENNTVSLIQISASAISGSSLTTDRIVFKINTQTASATDRTINLYYLGDINQSRTIPPFDIPTVGDMLKGVYNSTGDGIISGGGSGGSGGHVIVDPNGGSAIQENNLKFSGSNISVSDDSGSTIVTIPTAHLIESNGSSLDQLGKINFIGGSVTQNYGNDSFDVSLSGSIVGTGDYVYHIEGSLATGSGFLIGVVTKNITIGKIYIVGENLGTGGSTVIDVNIDGSSIFTDQANRPQLNYDSGSSYAVSGTPDVIGFSVGNVITFDIDEIAINASTLDVIIQVIAASTPTMMGNSGSVIDGHLAVFDGSSGYVLKDGGEVPVVINPIYPQRATMWGDEMIVTDGTSTVSFLNTSQVYATYRRATNPSANNDAFTFSFMLTSGSYNFSNISITSTDEGKVDWYIDNVLSASGMDFYSNPQVYSVIKTVSVYVPTSGRHVLKGIVNGKNGSSSGYVVRLTKLWIYPSSDITEV